jgi:hypothetical protein
MSDGGVSLMTAGLPSVEVVPRLVEVEVGVLRSERLV